MKDFFGRKLDHDYSCLSQQPFLEEDISMFREVANEAAVVAYTQIAFENPCRQILRALYGVTAAFYDPRGSLKLGHPDRVLRFHQDRNQEFSRSRFMIEVKTPWALRTHPTLDLPNYYNKHHGDFKSDAIIKAIHQIYGYMTLNSLRYGILTNGDATFIFRRVHDNKDSRDDERGGVLECSPTISITGQEFESPVAAYAFVAALSYEDGWSYHSLADDLGTPPTELQFDQAEEILAPLPTKKLFTTTKGLSFQLGRLLGDGVASTTVGTIVYRKTSLCNCIVKTYDLVNQEAEQMFEQEYKIYQQLSHFQGLRIPRLYLKGNIMGLIGILILEDCGEELQEGAKKVGAKKAVLETLQQIHAKGVLHNDLALRNIVFNPHEPPESAFRLIDFGFATLNATERECQDEMAMLEALDLA
ncbi:hypothetical protein TWF696_006743 [Orbilia brochopaga]|uniref:EKC/KEOPS complex subunit BUD32 n=1 Tax=Orbilia brochopaga TaxID=3140254 RepID=A0AAV9UU41_9PEZI